MDTNFTSRPQSRSALRECASADRQVRL